MRLFVFVTVVIMEIAALMVIDHFDYLLGPEAIIGCIIYGATVGREIQSCTTCNVAEYYTLLSDGKCLE